MSIGFGIVLAVIGAILLFAVNANFPYISDDALGIILILAGLATIGLGFALSHQRSNTSHTAHVEERRYEQGP
jgi:uncharacterized membrane protein YidH (DUF202 family)